MSGTVLRSQQIRIKKGHPLYNYCDQMCFNAKNLYNIGNFYIRQVFTGLKKDPSEQEVNEQVVINTINNNISQINNIKKQYTEKRRLKELSKPTAEQKEIKEAVLFDKLSKESPYLSYYVLESVFKVVKQVDYVRLPAHINQHVLKQLFRDWKSFYKSLADYKVNPAKYLGRPKIPKYAKKDGRKICTLTNQICTIKNNKYLKLPHTKYKLNIGKLGLCDKLKEIRIIPKTDHYIVEVVLEHVVINALKTETPDRIIGIDLGVNNLATIVNNIFLSMMELPKKNINLAVVA